jgi:enamine deaminase RidA (YjgF/YER057c/UK114 family)
MKIERHETGPRMSKAVIHGDTVYLAGIVADNPKGKSMAEQTSNILSQIDGFLAMAGTNKTKLLSANIWITDMAHFAEMNSVWDAWVSPGNTPLTSCSLLRRKRQYPWRPERLVRPCI